MQIRNFEPMPTRPCKYCLALQDDSVFVDLNITENGCLYIVRISFDGYGCCYPDPEIGIGKIGFEESALLISIIENGSFHEPKASEILIRYFKENEATLWRDALKDHELISA